MKNCRECGHNEFSFKSNGSITTVTCRNCKNQFDFTRSSKPVVKDPKCPKCKEKMLRLKVVLTPDVLLEPFYYAYFFRCNKCGETIVDPTTKRHNALYARHK